jgi:magnesium-transporting ATPase (P-type)
LVVPNDYDQVVAYYGLLGYRIIAMAKRILKDEEFFLLDRKQVERNMDFVGFIILKSSVRYRDCY